MNKTKTTLTAFLLLIALTVNAQGDYIVKTTTQSGSTIGSEEQLFTVNNFPYISLCDWKAGQKFMLILEEKYGFIPILKSATSNREVSNNQFQQKILEFQGVEEIGKDGTVSATRFLFEVEGEKYYYEVKNQPLNAICLNNPRVIVHNLVYLADVDLARELLLNKTLYTKVKSARIDDGNTSSGYREVTIPLNLEVTVTAVGAGTRECPVKLVFQDKEGNSYYRNVMFSRTNSGLLEADVAGPNLEKYFPNAFSFTDKAVKTNEDIRTKYKGRAVYPKHTVEAIRESGGRQSLLRFTPLVVKDLIVNSGSTMATLKLADKNGDNFRVEVNLKYDVFIRNENYIDDMFGYGDLRKQYPTIDEETWSLLGNGEVRTGMTKDECFLALGSPIQIVAKPNSRYETWYYQGRTLEFDGIKLLRIK